MANKVTMTICGQEYTLVADESAAYMEQVGTLVNQRMRQTQETLRVSRADAAVLAAVNLADELLKNQAAAENLRRQVKNYLDEEFRLAHPVIEFQTADGVEQYTVFAVAAVQKTDTWYSFIHAADSTRSDESPDL